MISKDELIKQIQSSAVEDALKEDLLKTVEDATVVDGDLLFLLQQKISNSSEGLVTAMGESMKQLAVASFETNAAMLQQESEKLAAEIAKEADEIDMQDARTAIGGQGQS
jgi:hypothetical protein